MDLNLINLRKIIQLFCYYLIPIFLLLSLIFQIFIGSNLSDVSKDYGEPAFFLIGIILFIKPLSIIFSDFKLYNTNFNPFQFILSYRREMGVLAFWFSIIHGLGLIYSKNLFSIQGLLILLNPFEIFLFSGFLAMIGMIILGLTSNKLSVMKFKRNWKKIQSLAYPTFALVCIHVTFAKKDEFGPILLFVTYTILKIVIHYKILKKINLNVLNKKS